MRLSINSAGIAGAAFATVIASPFKVAAVSCLMTVYTKFLTPSLMPEKSKTTSAPACAKVISSSSRTGAADMRELTKQPDAN
ncbi:MAG: hypothetical protein PHQ60_14580, partial [Sideroxydans sp.]|nr:hypothetical protein [Sideroxydans sp.]